MKICRVDVKDMTERMHLDEAHAMDVARGSNDWQIVVGDELVTFDSMIAMKAYQIKGQLKDGHNKFKYTHNNTTIQVYVWIEKLKHYMALGTRNDVIGEIGKEETARLDALYEEKK